MSASEQNKGISNHRIKPKLRDIISHIIQQRSRPLILVVVSVEQRGNGVPSYSNNRGFILITGTPF